MHSLADKANEEFICHQVLMPSLKPSISQKQNFRIARQFSQAHTDGLPLHFMPGIAATARLSEESLLMTQNYLQAVALEIWPEWK